MVNVRYLLKHNFLLSGRPVGFKTNNPKIHNDPRKNEKKTNIEQEFVFFDGIITNLCIGIVQL
jgi:hypothetical protein